MKVMFHGEEIELDDKIEKGEKELDMTTFFDELEDTIELTDYIDLIKEKEKEYDLSQTKEFKAGDFDYE